ncbi:MULTISPECIES: tRNA (guanosine(37)-N1)-methyltransferase TrmD [Oceanotoga]|nr:MULTISPECIES: tRNA (guanosine(37)-N1)-methyltransferase TrmD [Oceanotoga]MDO7976192.1 tRNA (guanosine(37)-N1)-methyltransferase TrmD [Oceanotoga teriensis]
MMEQKMKIKVLSIFPNMFNTLFEYGVLKKSIENGIVDFEAINLRDYTDDKHHVTDIPGYGGKSGMVMKVEPFFKYYEEYSKDGEKPYVIMTSPQGIKFDNSVSRYLSEKKKLLFLCGRYEGIDARIEKIVDKEVSIGDFVVTGGEIPAMLMIDSLLRFVPGVVGDNDSVINDSFYNGLLDYSQYTKPYDFNGEKVPEILLSGNHLKIEKYRKKNSLLNTILKRKDLFIKRKLSEEEKELLTEIIGELYNNAK